MHFQQKGTKLTTAERESLHFPRLLLRFWCSEKFHGWQALPVCVGSRDKQRTPGVPPGPAKGENRNGALAVNP